MLKIIGKLLFCVSFFAILHAENISIEKRESNDKAHISAEIMLDKTSAFVDEKISYKIRILYDMRAFEVLDIVFPVLSGVKQDELEGPVKKRILYEGKPALLFEWFGAFYPQKKGFIEVPPVELSYIKKEDQRRSGALMNSLLSVFKKSVNVLYSGATGVEVRPLPAYQKEVFGIGSFNDCTLSLSEKKGENSRVLELFYTISGEGNLGQLDHPKLSLSDRIKVYPSSKKSSVGSTTFTYVVHPLKGGAFEVPPQALTFFNPDSSSYYSLESNAVRGQVDELFIDNVVDDLQELLEVHSDNVIKEGKDGVFSRAPIRYYSMSESFFYTVLILCILCGIVIRVRLKIKKIWYFVVGFITYKKQLWCARSYLKSCLVPDGDGSLRILYDVLYPLHQSIEGRAVELRQKEKYNDFWTMLLESRFKQGCTEAEKRRVFEHAEKWLGLFK